jgi:hypothetical protein
VETSPPAEDTETTPGRQAAAGLQRVQHLLRDLGMPEGRLRRITRWTTLDERDEDEYVYVPPLPLDVAHHLVRLVRPLPPGAPS